MQATRLRPCSESVAELRIAYDWSKPWLIVSSKCYAVLLTTDPASPWVKHSWNQLGFWKYQKKKTSFLSPPTGGCLCPRSPAAPFQLVMTGGSPRCCDDKRLLGSTWGVLSSSSDRGCANTSPCGWEPQESSTQVCWCLPLYWPRVPPWGQECPRHGHGPSAAKNTLRPGTGRQLGLERVFSPRSKSSVSSPWGRGKALSALRKGLSFPSSRSNFPCRHLNPHCAHIPAELFQTWAWPHQMQSHFHMKALEEYEASSSVLIRIWHYFPPVI